eukprot:1154239-Pelagomonas_calceolata.AAC.2
MESTHTRAHTHTSLVPPLLAPQRPKLLNGDLPPAAKRLLKSREALANKIGKSAGVASALSSAIAACASPPSSPPHPSDYPPGALHYVGGAQHNVGRAQHGAVGAQHNVGGAQHSAAGVQHNVCEAQHKLCEAQPVRPAFLPGHAAPFPTSVPAFAQRPPPPHPMHAPGPGDTTNLLPSTTVGGAPTAASNAPCLATPPSNMAASHQATPSASCMHPHAPGAPTPLAQIPASAFKDRCSTGAATLPPTAAIAGGSAAMPPSVMLPSLPISAAAPGHSPADQQLPPQASSPERQLHKSQVLAKTNLRNLHTGSLLRSMSRLLFLNLTD